MGATVEFDYRLVPAAHLGFHLTATTKNSSIAHWFRPISLGEAPEGSDRCKYCGVPVIVTFATGLEGNNVTVRAALAQPWSGGQAEGQINRLKLIKRQSCGRAGLDLLRRRLMLAS